MDTCKIHVAKVISPETGQFEELLVAQPKCGAFEILVWVNTIKQMQHKSQNFSKIGRPRAAAEMISLVLVTLGCYVGVLNGQITVTMGTEAETWPLIHVWYY